MPSSLFWRRTGLPLDVRPSHVRPLFGFQSISFCGIAHGSSTPAIWAIRVFSLTWSAARYIGCSAGRAYSQPIRTSGNKEQLEREGTCEPSPSTQPDGCMLGIRPIQVWHQMYQFYPFQNDPAEAKACTFQIELVPHGWLTSRDKIGRAKQVPIFWSAQCPHMDGGHNVQQCPQIPRAIPPSGDRFIQFCTPSHGPTGGLPVFSVMPGCPGAAMRWTDLQDTPTPSICRNGGCRRVGEFDEPLQKSTSMAHTRRRRLALMIAVAIIEHIVFNAHVCWGIFPTAFKQPSKLPPVTYEATKGPVDIHSPHPVFVISSYSNHTQRRDPLNLLRVNSTSRRKSWQVNTREGEHRW
jgi:hypothetical protein